MGIQTTQGFNVKLVANDVILDLFEDEEIKVSDNVTGLFDIAKLPSDFVRNISLPGSKKNNEFFQHYYDISITNPFLFATNIKIDAYLDLDGFYIAEGYLQLNKVNVRENKYIDSYDISLFGSISSFSRETSRSYITELSNLDKYNHTSSLQNISQSWDGNLFDGDIVYPLADYGQNIEFATGFGKWGFNRPSSSLTISDFKPAIRMKVLFDSIFEEYGYTYSSSFMEQPFLDDIYVIANNELQYPEYDGLELDGYGVVQVSPTEEVTDLPLTASVYKTLSWANVEEDVQNFMDGADYRLPVRSGLSGRTNLKFRVSGSEGMPQFTLRVENTSGGTSRDFELQNTNRYMRQLYYTQTGTGDQVLESEEEFFFTEPLPADDYIMKLKYETFGSSSFDVTLAPDGDTDSYWAIDKVRNVADNRIIRLSNNLPFGEDGITQANFIRAIQKKFNLIIYPSKTKSKTFIIETFNDWYKNGEVKSFDNFIDVDKNIEVIPANNLAVNRIEFGDMPGVDYLSEIFKKTNNREYGKTIFTDTENFFSQGEFKVQTDFASSPLRYVQGTGISGSFSFVDFYSYRYKLSSTTFGLCSAQEFTVYQSRPPIAGGEVEVGDVLHWDNTLLYPITNYKYLATESGIQAQIDQNNGEVISIIGQC